MVPYKHFNGTAFSSAVWKWNCFGRLDAWLEPFTMASIPSSSGSITRTFGLRSSRQLESKLRRLLAHGRDDLLLICLCGDDRIYHQQANCTAFDHPFHQRSRTAPVGIRCAELCDMLAAAKPLCVLPMGSHHSRQSRWHVQQYSRPAIRHFACAFCRAAGLPSNEM